jgi:hypothetical protein
MEHRPGSSFMAFCLFSLVVLPASIHTAPSNYVAVFDSTDGGGCNPMAPWKPGEMIGPCLAILFIQDESFPA